MSGGLPAWFEPGPHPGRKRQNRRSREQETRIATAMGGRRQAGSGSSWRAPQDIKTEDYLVQVKYTDRASFTLKRSEWDSLARDAARAGRDPIMVIEFTGGKDPGPRLVVTEWHGDD